MEQAAEVLGRIAQLLAEAGQREGLRIGGPQRIHRSRNGRMPPGRKPAHSRRADGTHQHLNQVAAYHLQVAHSPLGVLPLHGLHQAQDIPIAVMKYPVRRAHHRRAKLAHIRGKKRGKRRTVHQRPVHVCR